MKHSNGFYTALGTPLDENGNLVADSLRTHIRQQIDAGAAGILLMGSMGIEATLKLSTYKECVKVGVEEALGKIPLFIGAMDTSIAKVMEKINIIGDAEIDGIVLTTPFYGSPSDEMAINFFTKIADMSPRPIYIYDLAVTVHYKITMPVIDVLIKHPNIKGMKTADWELIHKIGRTYPNAEFECLYSGLDSFDYASLMGIGKNLDGMFACTPKNARKMYDCIEAKDFPGARKFLDNILLLRDTMLSYRLMSAFTYCMNLLGYAGTFNQDYCLEIKEGGKEKMEEIMKQIGEI